MVQLVHVSSDVVSGPQAGAHKHAVRSWGAMYGARYSCLPSTLYQDVAIAALEDIRSICGLVRQYGAAANYDQSARGGRTVGADGLGCP